MYFGKMYIYLGLNHWYKNVSYDQLIFNNNILNLFMLNTLNKSHYFILRGILCITKKILFNI